jgi:hypothetical protein
VDLRIEDDQAVPTTALGGIKRDIRAAYRCFKRIAGRHEVRANARGQPRLEPVRMREGHSAERVEDTQRRALQHRLITIGDHHHEFVAAPSTAEIALAQRSHHAPGCFSDDLVTSLVAEIVVQCLETINIEQKKAGM